MAFRLYKYILILMFSFMPSAYGIEEDVIYPDFKTDEKAHVFSFDKRENLENKGITIESYYIIDSFVMQNKSKKTSKGTYQGLYNLSLELDTEKMNMYKGGKLYALYQVGNRGVNSMEFMGSYSDISSYNPSRAINQISELYYEHNFKDDLFNLKIGKSDANVDFQALENGFEFLNLSFSYMPNTPLPLFPTQQAGVIGRVKLKEGIYLQNGFYDGNLDIGSNPKNFFDGKKGYFDILEAYKLTEKGKILAGGWLKKSNYGAYFGFEEEIYQNLNLFGRFAYAKRGANDVPYFAGIGLVKKIKRGDSIGLAFNWHQFDKSLKGKTAEKVVEIFYKIKLTDYLYLQPDIQYFIRPNGDMKNSIALGVRSIINF